MSDDDWDADLDAVNTMTTEESRWGSGGAAVDESHSMLQLREKVLSSDKDKKSETGYQSSYGYGGKFGVEKDRMDKHAMDSSYKAEISKHSSVVDNKVGFGGKYGVQKDRQDKSAADFSYKEDAKKHQSQSDYKKGFGGKFGVQHDRKDASAETWSYKAQTAKHASQTDGSKGFGGKYGVQSDRKDTSAHGWEGGDVKPALPSKPRPQSGVSVGNMKSMFEKPKTEQTTDSVAKYRAARAEQERKEREEQQARNKSQSTSENYSATSSSVVSNKPAMSRAEEARQLVAERSKVSATASQFNQKPTTQSSQPPLPRPAPTRPKAPPAPIATVDPQPSVPSVDNSAAEQIEQQRRQAEQEQAEAERARQFEERRAMIEQQQKAAAAEMEKLRLEKEEKERQEQQASTVAANAVPSSLDVDTNGTVEQREAQPVVSPSDGLCAVAQFDYTAAGDDEVSFLANDVITHIDTSLDAGWWMGSCNGSSGLFPANFVESAADFSYKEDAKKHQSQSDYKKGFGGKFGVQHDRKDASAETWSYKAQTAKHASQTDGSKGFGGKFGVQSDRKDTSAHGWEGGDVKPALPSKPRPQSGVSVGNMKSMFEKPKTEQTTDSVAKYRAARAEQERKEREEQQARNKSQSTSENYSATSSSVVSNKPAMSRAEEARQLVAERSKVSATASQFNQKPTTQSSQPPLPRPAPTRPKAPPAPIATVDPQPSVPSVDNSAAELIEQQRRQAEREQAEAERARQFEERRAMIEQQQKAAADEMEKLRLEKEEKERQEQQASTVATNAVPSSLDVDTNGAVEQPEAQPVVSPSDGLCAVAQFDYTAAGDDEVSFLANDVITHIDTSLDAGWWMGSCNGSSGLFPANFVEIIESTRGAETGRVAPGGGTTIVGRESQISAGGEGVYFDPSVTSVSEDPSQIDLSQLPQAVAMYEFFSEDPQDLSFAPDEVIAVQNLENEDWWFGYIGYERHGYFPANHVQLQS
ncbi:uncharacterized protein LOC142335826 [Convolutriloba macropyga]|uniref:uncharacterized protein LOC142335826 n=1 Tax=Convolutriloba macropyga TaxID=536237 RepID=UPI003F526226